MPLVASLHERRHMDGKASPSSQAYATDVSYCNTRSQPTYPLSNTNNDSHILSLLRRSRWPQFEYGSTSSKPSSSNAFFAVMQSDFGTWSGICRWGNPGAGTISLFRDMSVATDKAMAMYAHVSSSAQCFPGPIHGTLTINARTISGDL